MTPQQSIRNRISAARHAAQAAGRPFEVWEGDGRTPQAFTCPMHPGQRLTLHQLRTAPPDPAAWLYLAPHGTTGNAEQPVTALDALSDAYSLALYGAPA